jgi:hypothetical protein
VLYEAEDPSGSPSLVERGPIERSGNDFVEALIPAFVSSRRGHRDADGARPRNVA